MNRKGFSLIVILLIVVVVLFVGGIAYYATRTPVSPQPQQLTLQNSTSTSTDQTMDWNVYRNDQYGFGLEYPQAAWQVATSNEGIEIALYAPEQSSNGMTPRFTIEVLPQEKDKTLENFYTTEITNLLGGNPRECKRASFLGVEEYDCRVSYEGVAHVMFFKNGDRAFEIYDGIQDATSSKTISTFQFAKVIKSGKESIYDLKIGDKVGDFTVTSIKNSGKNSGGVYDFVVNYEGQATIMGTKWINDMLGFLCVTATSTDAVKIPRLLEDNRNSSFCFNNQDVAAQALKNAGSVATITIANYKEDHRPIKAVDTADFVRVSSK